MCNIVNWILCQFIVHENLTILDWLDTIYIQMFIPIAWNTQTNSILLLDFVCCLNEIIKQHNCLMFKQFNSNSNKFNLIKIKGASGLSEIITRITASEN